MTSPGGFPQLSFLCHREEFQTQCGLSALSCLPQQEMAVVKLGPLKPVLHGVVDFCSPQSVFGGQTRKLTCHLSLKFDLSPYLQTATPRPHSRCTQHTLTCEHTRTRHSGPHELTREDAVRCAKRLLWNLLPWTSSVSVSGRITKGQESLWFMT